MPADIQRQAEVLLCMQHAKKRARLRGGGDTGIIGSSSSDGGRDPTSRRSKRPQSACNRLPAACLMDSWWAALRRALRRCLAFCCGGTIFSTGGRKLLGHAAGTSATSCQLATERETAQRVKRSVTTTLTAPALSALRRIKAAHRSNARPGSAQHACPSASLIKTVQEVSKRC